MPSLSISFPAYNEEANIGTAIEDAMRVAAQLTDDYEVIVVNDGSADNTAGVVREYASRYPQVRLIEHEVKEFRTAYIAVNENLTLEQEMTEAEAKKAATISGIRILRVPRERVRITITCGTALIDTFYPDRPYEGFSLIPAYAYKYDGERGWNGKVHFMKKLRIHITGAIDKDIRCSAGASHLAHSHIHIIYPGYISHCVAALLCRIYTYTFNLFNRR